jgi:hypothetical protein
MWIAVLSLAATLACQWITGIAECAGLPKTKDDFINDILSQLKGSYSVDPLLAGQTFRVDIKDFSPTDDETYAVVERLDDFWIIVLPAERKKIYGTDQELCVCRSHKVKFVRKETRRNDAKKFTRQAIYRAERVAEKLKPSNPPLEPTANIRGKKTVFALATQRHGVRRQ